MDELAYIRYCDRGKAADDIFRAVKDGLLTKDDREFVLEFHPVR